VTHYCGAPIVHSMLINAPAELRAGITTRCAGLVAGAPPPAAMIEGMAKIGFDITHVYGLTETYGPAAVCAKHPTGRALPLARAGPPERPPGRALPRCRKRSRCSTRDHAAGALGRRDHGRDHVPRQHRDEGLPEEPEGDARRPFAGGWYHTGDLAVMQPDGYVKIKDRSKDVIISGGENISSIEVEDVLYRHPAVMAAAVVATPDPKWGEVPCAFIELREGQAEREEMIEFCRSTWRASRCPSG
jgi:fatty-acyl-CoA synthase